ncbi:MAG: siderophore-interacting protein [Pseudomonadota bacterium]
MPTQYDLSVRSNRPLSPHMRRIELQGDCLANFPEGYESAHVKGAFPEGAGVVRRSYTVLEFNRDQRYLTIDFVDHGDTGPASRWARQARVGDPLTLYGPGPKKLVDPAADWFLIAGDMTALPAIGVNLAQLPGHARGYAVIEVVDGRDMQDLTAPSGIEVVWIVAPDSRRPNAALVDAVVALPWLEGTPYPWFAGEFDAMRRVRTYLREYRGLDKGRMYLSCYWKYGDTDEGMKRAKRLDAQAEASRAEVLTQAV